jgi:hypothetical protein
MFHQWGLKESKRACNSHLLNKTKLWNWVLSWKQQQKEGEEEL